MGGWVGGWWGLTLLVQCEVVGCNCDGGVGEREKEGGGPPKSFVT